MRGHQQAMRVSPQTDSPGGCPRAQRGGRTPGGARGQGRGRQRAANRVPGRAPQPLPRGAADRRARTVLSADLVLLQELDT